MSTPFSSSKDWLSRLANHGYRLTEPRRVIVEIIAASDRALNPLEVFDLGRDACPGLGLVTVYRTLEKLEELGLVQRVHQADGCHAYLRAANGHEHILLCNQCGQAVFFAGDDLTSLLERVARQSGFEIQEHWLQLHGLCARCRDSVR
jgi:Fe2+ or Zn2+ uptake regulation protein